MRGQNTMQRFYNAESHGPDFDDRLIKLVRDNPAIYDVNHPLYRRNPVRVAIWNRIATELSAPSRFLQTKWKNIRYNYLQEIKCLETGHSNANVRKRRFTEDLSFLQNTAQIYKVKKEYQKFSSYHSSDNDNDSNSYMYPPESQSTPNAYEVIEIEHSDDDCSQHEDFTGDDIEQELSSANNATTDTFDAKAAGESGWEANTELTAEPHMSNQTAEEENDDQEDQPEAEPQLRKRRRTAGKNTRLLSTEAYTQEVPDSPTPSYTSNPSSPLLTPLVVMGNGKDNDVNGEISIDPLPKAATAPAAVPTRPPRPKRVAPSEIMNNIAKRKAMPAPFPVLQPINDPIEMYCLSLVDTLRSMPRSERERVKYEFSKILKDATYKDQS